MGSVLLFAIMAVTFVDVVGRYFLNAPLRGGFELTEIMMAAMIALGMPLVTASDEHIKVDLLDQFVSEKVRSWQVAFGSALSGLVSALVAWTLWTKAGQLAAYNDHTEMLRLPLAPIAYILSVMMVITAAIFFLKSLPARQRT
jgi:TRAP-type C4-dicarboxylate transport system permease small subunit